MLAELSELAYSDLKHNSQEFFNTLDKLSFKLVAPLENTDTDTQGFLVTNDKCAVLCFRGTYDLPGDIATDLRGKLVNEEHEGIFKAFNSVEGQVLDALQLVSHLPIYCTGHSLGGALAKAAILKLPQVHWQACYTFGSPPVCTKERFNENKVPTFLIVNEGDLVPRVMQLEFLGDVALLLLELVDAFLQKIESKHALDNTKAYAQSLKLDMKKYAHFGEIKFLKTNGLILSSGDSIEIFKAAVGSKLSVALDHHKMNLYVSNIKNYISLQLSLPPEPNP